MFINKKNPLFVILWFCSLALCAEVQAVPEISVNKDFFDPGSRTATAPVVNAGIGSGGQLIIPVYSLDISIDYNNHKVRVKQTTSIVNTAGEPVSELVFSFPPAVYPEVVSMGPVELQRNKTRKTVNPEFDTSMIVISLDRPLDEGDTIEVRFSFTLTLFEIFKTDRHPHGNFGYGSQVMQCGEFFPTLTPWVAGEGFRRWKYHGIGDAYLYPLADFRIKITAPPEIVVAAYGQVSGARGTWKFESLRARSWAFTASPDYKVLQGGTRNLPVRLYFVSDNSAAVEACLLTAERSVALFSELFGTCGKSELVVVENAYFSSMEYTGFVTISGSHMQTYTPAAPYLLVYVVAHEVAHQWWYGSVGTDQILEPWLDEGLATFSEYIFFNEFHPELTAAWRSGAALPRDPDHFIDDAIYDFGIRSEYIHTIYRTAPQFMYELSVAVGEKRFLEFLREFVRRQAGTLAGAGDFFQILREYTDEDLSKLTAKYFRRPPEIPQAPVR